MITTLLFDLDGTLLPMEQDIFTNEYLRLLCAKMAPLGYEAKALVQGIWAGVSAMVKNTGQRTNEEVFWDCFTSQFGESSRAHIPFFNEYYANDFQKVARVCGYQPQAKALLAQLKLKGIRTILATNPLFPAVATYSRIRCAGLQPEDFSYITTYENAHFCKPNPAYYREILERTGCSAEECLMVGNDVGEDMVAEQLGMQTFLLTDCLINSQKADISRFPQGGFGQLQCFLQPIL